MEVSELITALLILSSALSVGAIAISIRAHRLQRRKDELDIQLEFEELDPADTYSTRDLDNQYGTVTPLHNQIESYLQEESHNTDSPFFKPEAKKSYIISKSPFEPFEWEKYLENTGHSFANVKRTVRVARAEVLIEQGYLFTHNIEQLSSAVGYNSRSHFYQTFEAIKGIPFKDYNH